MERRSNLHGERGRAKGRSLHSCVSEAHVAACGLQEEQVGNGNAAPLDASFFPPEGEYPFDLFGNRISPTSGRKGRPRHVPTPETRAKVAELHQAGAKQPTIAAAIGITIPTLILNYPIELESKSRAWRRRGGAAK